MSPTVSLGEKVGETTFIKTNYESRKQQAIKVRERQKRERPQTAVK